MLSKDIFYIKDINKIIMEYKKDLDILLIKRQKKEKKRKKKRVLERQYRAFQQHFRRYLKF